VKTEPLFYTKLTKQVFLQDRFSASGGEPFENNSLKRSHMGTFEAVENQPWDIIFFFAVYKFLIRINLSKSVLIRALQNKSPNVLYCYKNHKNY